VYSLFINTMEHNHFIDTASSSNPTHLLAFASGRSGVGKTCVITNVAAAMVRRGVNVCILDADKGQNNVNTLLGLRPEYTLDHVLSGEKTVDDVLLKTTEGIAVLPGASAIADLATGNIDKLRRLSNALAELEKSYDFFLIDTATGIGDSIVGLIEATPTTFLIVTPEPATLNDAFSLLKLLNAKGYRGRLRVVVNQAIDYPIASETYRRFANAVEKHLQLNVEYGGFIARDDNVPRSVALQVPVIDLAADSPASRCLYALTDNVLKYIGHNDTPVGLSDYCQTLQKGNAPTFPDIDDAFGIPLATATKPTALDFEHLALQLAGAVNSTDADRTRIDRALSDLIDAYVRRFERFPAPARQWFFRWLETEEYSAARLLELTATLEALHMARHRKPLFTLEDSVARLVAQCQGSQQRFKALIDHLRAAFRQAFKTDVIDARREVLAVIKSEDFSEARFEALLSELREAHRQRFGHAYRGQSERLIESTLNALSGMDAEEQRIRQQIDALMESFHHLITRRDTLLNQLTDGQDDEARPASRSVGDS